MAPRLRLSKLYSFAACVRPSVRVSEPAVGGPGYSRVVFCNQSEKHRHKPVKYASNYVSTTKYTLLTFLPKAIFEQFRRIANLYFLFAAALSLTPLTPFRPSSLIVPLVFVVGVSMLKEGLEDWRRFMQDQEVNNRRVMVHSGQGRFSPRQWKRLRVGDVVKVDKDSFFPADLLLLSSSYPDGICYVETSNLDGETNLKIKKSLERTLELNEEAEFASFSAKVHCEDPNPSLYTFVGNLDYAGDVLPTGPEQLLLRDSQLRNTQYVYGVVIFSGHDTKVMQNATEPPSKRSGIERKMDKIIYFLFSVLLLISFVGSIAFGVRTRVDGPSWWYLMPSNADVYFDPKKAEIAGLLHLITALILYGYLIPISLYVSIEVVKVLQAMFINHDREMYDDISDTPAHARTSNLNEELGQVDTILTDKTGTLTCNVMEFRKCSIAGTSYGRGITEVERATAKRLGREIEELESKAADMTPDDGGGTGGGGVEMTERPHVKGFNFTDERLMGGHWIRHPEAHTIRMFFRIFAVCHTVIPEPSEDGSGEVGYQAESPDELAFVVSAREFGFNFTGRSQSTLRVLEPDETSGQPCMREYKLLNLLEFNSTRKRMSVIVRDDRGDIFLFCKGADSVMFERLAKAGRGFESETKSHLSEYAEAGLRTLVLAYRKLDETEYNEWNATFMKAKTTIGANRDELLELAADQIEREFILLGATAVEDKLQKGVPECIDRLAQAGLKIWVLTGDKVETAINIGFACSLLRQGMKQIVISLDKLPEQFADQEAIAKASRDCIDRQLANGQQQIDLETDMDAASALIIDGKSLSYALEDALKDKFLRLAINCASVICCRVSPKQKALVTKLVKEGTGRTTLSIGDGANDVGMIQEADIGVGISGLEGMQAVMASDFSIAQFRFLERLLIVHGHWCYKRIAQMICYFFYKNITFGLTLFYFEAYTGFSGQTAYDDWYMSLFNVIFTSLPVIALGVFEQDVSARVCLMFPTLYQQGPRNLFFSWSRILGWMANGVYSSLITFFFIKSIHQHQAFRKGGQMAELAILGASMYTSVVWTVNCQAALAISYFTWIQHLVIWGSVGLWYLFLALYGTTSTASVYGVLTEGLGPAPIYWLATLLVPLACVLPYFFYLTFQRTFKPMDHHIIQEIRHLQRDFTEPEMWLRECSKAVERTSIGFSARVDARIRHIRSLRQQPQDHHHQQQLRR